MNRQRDLIELADMTISNSIGTHIGYCICLGTPHYLFAQKIDWAGGIKEQDRITLSTRVELYNAFGSRRPIITPQQIEIVKKYWGEFSDPVKQSFYNMLIVYFADDKFKQQQIDNCETAIL